MLDRIKSVAELRCQILFLVNKYANEPQSLPMELYLRGVDPSHRRSATDVDVAIHLDDARYSATLHAAAPYIDMISFHNEKKTLTRPLTHGWQV